MLCGSHIKHIVDADDIRFFKNCTTLAISVVITVAFIIFNLKQHSLSYVGITQSIIPTWQYLCYSHFDFTFLSAEY